MMILLLFENANGCRCVTLSPLNKQLPAPANEDVAEREKPQVIYRAA